jgi:CMP-N,N'-diacetyllegionaminic acid synthase
MKILAVILARGGSKRLPGKNVKLLGGIPLLEWSVSAAKNIPVICDILVSTDDSNIASIATRAGAYVPWLRSAELSTDTSSSIDATLHALNWYENTHGKVDGILLLQPTSPFRSKDTILKGIKLYSDNQFNTVLGVSKSPSHSMLSMKINNGNLVPLFYENGFNRQSQDLPPEFVINGSYYLVSPDNLRKYQSFITPNAIPLFIHSPQESLDIDTEWDWDLAEFIIQKYHLN